MTADQFTIQTPQDLALWFKYRDSRIDQQRFVWFKDVGAVTHYKKFKNIYDNIFRCLVSEGLNIREFVDLYFHRNGYHSPAGLEAFTETKCSGFLKNVKKHFAKTVGYVCDAMVRRNVSSSAEILNTLCDTGMLAPNYLAGKISVYWLAGVPNICELIQQPVLYTSKTHHSTFAFRHGDDFNSTFDTFLDQREVYYHILCRAFDRMQTGVNSLVVTDLRYKRVCTKPEG